jgi:hypothetical protein
MKGHVVHTLRKNYLHVKLFTKCESRTNCGSGCHTSTKVVITLMSAFFFFFQY